MKIIVMQRSKLLLVITIIGIAVVCGSQATNNNTIIDYSSPVAVSPVDTSKNVFQVFVALCDNQYQGIVPVPEKIGNGQDPNNNLYWGCAYGIRTWFKKSKEWKVIAQYKKDSIRLERIVFKHRIKNIYLVADAYDGKFIRQCTNDFLLSCSGKLNDTIKIGDVQLGIGGKSKLLSYIGHDGLMDFQLSGNYENTDDRKRDIIILACYSKRYFSPYLTSSNINPLVWTTGLMCPEAYTLHDAFASYLNGESGEAVRTAAAKAYSKYQKCSEKAARNLLVSDK